MSTYSFTNEYLVRGVQVSFASFQFYCFVVAFWDSIAFVLVFIGVPFNGQKTIRRQFAVLSS